MPRGSPTAAAEEPSTNVIETELPTPPVDAPVVETTRKITVPWRGWINEWLRRLAAGLRTSAEAVAALAEGVPSRIIELEVDLGSVPACGGRLELEGEFLEGAPAIAMLKPRGDEGQGLLTSAYATIRDERTVVVDWASSSPLAGRVTVQLVIGGVSL